MAEKVNPRKIPRTQADVEKAHADGLNTGGEIMLLMLFFILVDKHQAPTEDLHQLMWEVDSYFGDLASGAISYADVRHTLLDEYGIRLNWTEGGRFGSNRKGGKLW